MFSGSSWKGQGNKVQKMGRDMDSRRELKSQIDQSQTMDTECQNIRPVTLGRP